MKNRQAGFTIIELLIATAIFSFIALIATTGIIRIGQMYYKGITVAKTQEKNRTIIEEISSAVQFADASLIDQSDAGRTIYCLGDTRYYFTSGTKSASVNTATPVLDLGKKGLVSQKFQAGRNCNNCPVINPTGCSQAPVQMLGENMRLLTLKIQPSVGGTSAWSISVGVSYGDPDLIDAPYNTTKQALENAENATCKSGIPGGSFCATSRLDTIVKRRLK